MNELLKKLLEAEILSEESKKELEDAFQIQLEKVEAEVREETKLRVETELKAQWVNERDVLIEAVDAKINDFLVAEMEELRKDISDFRDLEAEYASRIVAEKASMAKQLQADMTKLVESLDTFLEMRLQQEFDEMREDIREVKKHEFGRKVFEAFLPEYRKHFVDASAVERELREAKEKINVLNKKYKNVRKDKDSLVRKVKLEHVLSPLSGKTKDIMETILQSVATDELEDAYSKFINRVLKESNDSSKSTPTTISESATTTTVKSGVVKTGNTAGTVTESVGSTTTESSGLVLEFKKLAGIA